MNRTKTWLTAAIVLIVCVAQAAPAVDLTLPAWRPGPHGDLAFESSAFLRQAAYRKPDNVANELNENGAYSGINQVWDNTKQGRWMIEEQRYGFDAFVAGISYHRQDLIDRGEKIFDWGFRQEQPDGSFDCADRFHSMSFFVEVAAHAALLLEASEMRPANQAWVDKISPKLRLAVGWMIDPKNEERGRHNDDPYTHRFYLDADAIGETGVLLHDEAMIKHSRDYIRAGIARQLPTGANPEKGGTDTSYHSVGLLFAMDYYTLVANDETRAQMQPMLARGMDWLKARVRPDGTVDQSGNTRTGFGQERGPNGTLKFMSYGSAYRAAFYWSMIMGDASWAKIADALSRGQEVEKKQRAPA